MSFPNLSRPESIVIDTELDHEELQVQIDDDSQLTNDLLTRKLLYSVYRNGSGFTSEAGTAAEFGIPLRLETRFYRLQPTFILPALELAKKSCKECFEAHQSNVVSIDAGWSVQRKAPFAVADIIDVETKKMVDFQIITSKNFNVDHPNLTCLENEASNIFEAAGVRVMADRDVLQTARKFVHDKDVQIKNILIDEKNLNIAERADPNHLAKSLFKHIKQPTNPLHVLHEMLRDKFISINKKYPQEEKKIKWMEFYSKLISQDAKWKGHDNPETCETLHVLFKNTVDAYDLLEAGIHTNFNEAFHAEKTVIAGKGGYLDYSWIIRTCLAIVKFNHRNNYDTILRNFFGAPPPTNPLCQLILKKRTDKSKTDYLRRSTDEYKNKEGTRRHFESKQPKSEKEYQYKIEKDLKFNAVDLKKKNKYLERQH